MQWKPWKRQASWRSGSQQLRVRWNHGGYDWSDRTWNGSWRRAYCPGKRQFLSYPDLYYGHLHYSGHGTSYLGLLHCRIYHCSPSPFEIRYFRNPGSYVCLLFRHLIGIDASRVHRVPDSGQGIAGAPPTKVGYKAFGMASAGLLSRISSCCRHSFF